MDISTPPVTRAYLVGAVGISLAVQCHLVTPFQLFFTYRAAFEHFQLWRVITNFLYWGPIGLDFMFHIFFFMRYSKMLEENTFHGRRGEYVWLLIVSCSLLLLLSPLSATPFLSSPLSFTLVYLWSRLNPSVRLSLFGVITITAPYLPYALIVFSWALNNGGVAAGGGGSWGWGVVMGDLMGIMVGHWWYFWTEIWKREYNSGGRNWLECPRFLTLIFDGRERLAEQDAERIAADLGPRAVPDPAPVLLPLNMNPA